MEVKRVKIVMLDDRKGHDVDDAGIMKPVKTYRSGQEYEVGMSLATSFVEHQKVAEFCSRRSRKALSGAPENKGGVF